jgi:EAL domain-containing protein (putative c-di-GMP-specific phosphodiesterase class I)
MIPPGAFIPVAETSGLIRPLGQWILDEACQQASTWAQAGHPLAWQSICLPPRCAATNS